VETNGQFRVQGGCVSSDEDLDRERFAGSPDALFRFAGGWSAEVSSGFEVCGLSDPFEPLFEGEVVREMAAATRSGAGRRTMCQASVRRKWLGVMRPSGSFRMVSGRPFSRQKPLTHSANKAMSSATRVAVQAP
jgi:hypothetical protein